jgi:hypothetical protein
MKGSKILPNPPINKGIIIKKIINIPWKVIIVLYWTEEQIINPGKPNSNLIIIDNPKPKEPPIQPAIIYTPPIKIWFVVIRIWFNDKTWNISINLLCLLISAFFDSYTVLLYPIDSVCSVIFLSLPRYWDEIPILWGWTKNQKQRAHFTLTNERLDLRGITDAAGTTFSHSLVIIALSLLKIKKRIILIYITYDIEPNILQGVLFQYKVSINSSILGSFRLVIKKQSIFTMTSYWFHKSIVGRVRSIVKQLGQSHY